MESAMILDCGGMTPLFLHVGTWKRLPLITRLGFSTMQPKRRHVSALQSVIGLRPTLLIMPNA
jgi:hypothetical protein